jgi:hypothetical protein
MNGRIYDPTLGRFLQADPFIQAPTNSQSYNRYSYVLNNPLSMTDPSGYFFSGLKKFVKKYGRMIVAAVASYYTFGAASAYFGSVIAGGAAAGFVGGAIATGSLKGALTGALTGAFTGAVFAGIGSAFNASSGFFETGGLGHIGSHALTGGILSDLQGGNFGHGFWSAGLTKAANVNGMVGTEQGVGWDTARIAVAATIGGTISKITGGKFGNGAVTAGFAQMLNGNQQAGKIDAKRKKLAALAMQSEGDKSYAMLAKNGRFAAGTWKCNQFVADQLKGAGMSPIMLSEGSAEFMTANGWANKNHNIPGWEIVDSPLPGDVAAIPRSGGSGHVGIYVEDRGYFNSSVMAANEMGVGWSGSHLRNNYFNSWAGANNDTVYRRYVGGN